MRRGAKGGGGGGGEREVWVIGKKCQKQQVKRSNMYLWTRMTIVEE